MRPLETASHPPSTQASRLATGLRRLLTVNLAAPDLPVAFAGSWFSGFSQAGRAIAEAGPAGDLERGTRSILAHLVIFHWNRLGFTTHTQAILSRALRDTIMDAVRKGVI